VSSSNHKVNNINDGCFIYILKQSNQIDEDVLNKMSCRALSKFLTIRHINRLAHEFDLSCKVIYYNATSTREQKVVLNRLSKQDCLANGLSNGSKAKHNKQIIISLWKSHYFISELTPFYDSDFELSLRYKSYKPPQLTSVNLLTCSMTKGLSRLMSVEEEPSKIISVPQFVSLSYNSEYCCRLTNKHQANTYAKQSDQRKIRKINIGLNAIIQQMS
jgi:hypothetical protein